MSFDPAKLAKLQNKNQVSRTGGKGSIRRKHKTVRKTATQDDKRLRAVLNKLNVRDIPAIEEVNLFKGDGTVVNFKNPKVQASIPANTYVVSGTPETKKLHEMLPGIMNQLAPENLEDLKKMYSQFAAQDKSAAAANDDIPDLVDNFDAAPAAAPAPAPAPAPAAKPAEKKEKKEKAAEKPAEKAASPAAKPASPAAKPASPVAKPAEAPKAEEPKAEKPKKEKKEKVAEKPAEKAAEKPAASPAAKAAASPAAKPASPKASPAAKPAEAPKAEEPKAEKPKKAAAAAEKPAAAEKKTKGKK